MDSDVLDTSIYVESFYIQYTYLVHNRKVWDAVTGDELKTFAHKHIVKCVAFSPDAEGTHLLTGSNEKLLRIFDLAKPEEGNFFLSKKMKPLFIIHVLPLAERLQQVEDYKYPVHKSIFEI